MTEIKDGVLFVGDLHLYNREMRSTKKMIENNEVMLKNLHDFIEENENIHTVIFLGDIQHRTPYGKNTLSETMKWEYWLEKMGKMVLKRFVKKKSKVKMRESGRDVCEDGITFSQQLKERKGYPLFTLRGNHDIDNDGSFTFFDSCIKKGLLINPQIVVIDNTQYNFHNYGELEKEYEVVAENIVGLYHDVIPTGDSQDWAVLDFKAKDYEDTVDDILGRVDLAVVGHIHTIFDPITHVFEDNSKNTRGNDVVVWYTGSMGRTASDKGQLRDVGYCGLIENSNLKSFGRVEIELIPVGEYFDLINITKRKADDEQFKDFTLGLKDTIHSEQLTPIEIINQTVEDIEVRKTCIEIMEEVLEEEV